MQHLTPRQPKDLFMPHTAIHNMGACLGFLKLGRRNPWY